MRVLRVSVWESWGKCGNAEVSVEEIEELKIV